VRVIGFKALSILAALKDGKILLDKVEAGERSEGEALASCDNRLTQIKGRLRVLAGTA
jgi:hypothetical protein